MDKKLKRLVENGYSYEAQAIIKNGIFMYQIEVFKDFIPISIFTEEENLNFDEPVMEIITQYKRNIKINSLLQINDFRN